MCIYDKRKCREMTRTRKCAAGANKSNKAEICKDWAKSIAERVRIEKRRVLLKSGDWGLRRTKHAMKGNR